MITSIILIAPMVTMAIIYTIWLYRRYKRLEPLCKKISQMSDTEIKARIDLLFDDLEDCYSSQKALEYQLLLKERRKRRH